MVNSYILDELVTDDNFDEESYLVASPDVAAAIMAGSVTSGRQHFHLFGKSEDDASATNPFQKLRN